ncbi:MAG: trypsin-like peptidase domain-containing protein [Pseudonocardia sp.]|nr:trypsin-like peptidase domain-containing protein [Pseudonocardia sp.]
MRRHVEVYAEWPDHPPERARWTCGSGYLLGGRLVLTAAHVVCRAGRVSATVQVRAESGGLLAAEVAWHRFEGDVDVALLVVTDPGWPEPVWRHPVRWGRLVTTRAGQRCEAIGFPAVVARPQRRDTHHAVGVINPGALVKAGLYAVEVTNPPAGPDADGSRWQGMSGAVLLCDGLLVGIVTVDPAGFDSRRLVTVPVTAVTADPRFAALVAAHTGAVPIVEPVELAGLVEPVAAPDSPAGLLRAEVADTPFRPRPELAALQQWCQESEWSATRLVVGAGGQGKTRLARHLAAALAGEGWATVVLSERAGTDDIAVLSEVAVSTLVIVDYAEGRTHQLDALVVAMARAEAKVRLLLLARTAGAWRTERIDPTPHLAMLGDDRIVLELGPVDPTPEGRAQAWEQAVVALAPRLGGLDGYRDIDWTALAATLGAPRLDGERYRTILAVQMHALAELLQAGDPVSAGGGPQEVLLAHESRYWSRVADRFGITLTAPTRRCLVATATLWGAVGTHDARRVLAVTLPGADPDALSNTADWLATLYQDRERYWSGLQPDPLAEYLIGTVLGPNGRCPTLVTDTITAVSPGQLEHGLTLLGRAHPQHPHLTQTIAHAVLDGTAGTAAITVAPRLEDPRPLLAAVDRLIDTADVATLRVLGDTLPRHSMLLATTSVKVTAALVGLLREATEADRDAYLPDLAMSVNNLAIRLGEAGRRVEGLAAAQEAVDLRRELVELNRDAYLPDLAGSVNNLAADLGEAGRREQALTLATEASEYYHELARTDPEVFGPNAQAAESFVTALLENKP